MNFDEERERRANRIFAIHAACSLLGIVLASLILARYTLEWLFLTFFPFP